MKVVLVAGTRHKHYIKYITKDTLLNAKVSLTIDTLMDYLRDYNVSVDSVVITDGGFGYHSNKSIEEIAWELSCDNVCITVVTHDFYLKNELAECKDVNVVYSFFLRITGEDIDNALKLKPTPVKQSDSMGNKIRFKKMHIIEEEKDDTTTMPATSTNPKHKPFAIGSGKKNTRQAETNSFSGINRAVAFTGRAGSGITSTVVNLAYSAAKRGMSVIILDLDLDYRAMNLYFNRFCAMAEESNEVSRSLIMTIAKPHDYMTTAVPVADNLWVAGLGYDFDDNRAIENFCTDKKIAALVSALKNKFDFVFVDFSLDTLSKYPGVMMHFDTFALCVENNLHSVVTTLRTLINGFNPDDIRYLNIKSKLIATKFNNESLFEDELLTPERLSDLMTSGMCDEFTRELQVVGAVPYTSNFDRQIENDVPIYETNSLMMRSYDEILSRL